MNKAVASWPLLKQDDYRQHLKIESGRPIDKAIGWK